MAGPIVFLNSEMATYASGVLMEVDYGNTVEERANIKPVQQVISLEGIYQMMQNKANNKITVNAYKRYCFSSR